MAHRPKPIRNMLLWACVICVTLAARDRNEPPKAKSLAQAPGALVDSGSLSGLEKSPVLENRVPVGHARDVVGDGTGAANFPVRALGLQSEIAVLGGHETHVFEESLEQLLQHASRLGRQRSTL